LFLLEKFVVSPLYVVKLNPPLQNMPPDDILERKGVIGMNILKEFDKALVLEETKQNAIRNGY
jgi:hypothetical protein